LKKNKIVEEDEDVEDEMQEPDLEFLNATNTIQQKAIREVGSLPESYDKVSSVGPESIGGEGISTDLKEYGFKGTTENFGY
jgi:hypothetical protein